MSFFYEWPFTLENKAIWFMDISKIIKYKAVSQWGMYVKGLVNYYYYYFYYFIISIIIIL